MKEELLKLLVKVKPTRLKSCIFRPLDKVLDSEFIIQQSTSEINLESALSWDGSEKSELERFIRREFVKFCQTTLPYSAEEWRDTYRGVLRNGESLVMWAISAPKRGAGSADPRKEFFKAVKDIIIEACFKELHAKYVVITNEYKLCRRGMQLTNYSDYVLKNDLA